MMTKMTPFCPASRRIAGGGRGAWKRWPEVPKKLVLAPKYFRVWPTANVCACISRDFPDRYRSVPGEALA
jgi:hypothetical protein